MTKYLWVSKNSTTYTESSKMSFWNAQSVNSTRLELFSTFKQATPVDVEFYSQSGLSEKNIWKTIEICEYEIYSLLLNIWINFYCSIFSSSWIMKASSWRGKILWPFPLLNLFFWLTFLGHGGKINYDQIGVIAKHKISKSRL